MIPMLRRLLIPLAIAASAYGFGSWIVGWFKGREEPREELARCLGWLSDEMRPHWDRLFSDRRVLHNLKNLSTEWTRLSAQRASKAWAFFGALGWLTALVLLLILVV